MRISIHGMTLNLLQTFYAARVEDETGGMQLRSIIDDLSGAGHLKLKSILAENMDSCLAILRCLTNVVHTVGVHSKVPASLFWLGTTVLHPVVISIRAEVLQFMKACVETLDKQNVFRDFEAEPNKNPVGFVLMNAHKDLREATVVLGALEVVMSMLRIAMRCSPGAANEERKSLDSLTMRLLMGIAHCYNTIDAHLNVSWNKNVILSILSEA
ncbi:hypothetical protein Clacol_004597 [Clathrus columnatus]|uniref:Uncharacterized protein n=1 Tax=Clathrus columnatus TaxID=1419009 RepID=A0AAV5AD03_9AGAM|nr:hypothetical protein Clacol_004597 [Clathrus columnatus]